jgi:hypothetical protein
MRAWLMLVVPLVVGCGGAGSDEVSAPTTNADGNADTDGSGSDTATNSWAALDEACTPTFELDLQDTGPGGQLFVDTVQDPEAFVLGTGRRVCRVLYRKAEEVRPANHIKLIIREDEIPGWKAGDVGNITVMISSSHLLNVQSAGGDVAAELAGILSHEMTHMYQHDDRAQEEGSYANLANVIEGVADAVRIRLGYTPTGAQPSKSGHWDDEGYWKPAFFVLWVDNEYPDFIYQLNLSMVGGDGVAWAPDSFLTITGRSVDDLWEDYQAADCCSGSDHSCCL